MFRLAIVTVAVAAGLAACSGSGAPASDGPSPSPPDGRLTFGILLPTTGSDATLTPPIAAGMRAAVREINKAGGVNGERVRLLRADAEATAAAQSAQTLVDRSADVVIGTGDSDVTASVLDTVIGAGVMFVSPSDAAGALTQRDNGGLFWRTAAPDSFQGIVVADALAAEKVEKPALLVQQGTDAEALAAAIETAVTSTGGTVAAEPVLYDGDADVGAAVRRVRRSRPDGVVLVGAATSSVLGELVSQRLGPDRRPLVLAGGELTPQLAEGLAEGALDGALGTVPGAELAPAFRKQLDAVDPELSSTTWAPEAYDAVVVAALAAVAATSDRPEAIAGQMVNVTTGGDACDTFAECERLLGDGKDIDYSGPSGPIEFQADGNPGQAVMGVYEFGDGEWAPLQYVEGTVPPPAPAS